MRLLLHYLKFDFLRWRWLVLALWGLVLLHTGLFAWAEAAHVSPPEPGSVETPDMIGDVAAWVAHGALGWAALVLLLLAGSDSPVRRRTWLMTRAGSRGVRFTSRLGFVMGGIVLPLVVGYTAMPLAAGFDTGTVLHVFWLALQVAAPPAVALWLWIRAWPHPGGLLLGLALAGSVWAAAFGLELNLPREWFAMPPSWLVMKVLLSLPALLCLRAAGKPDRRAARYSCLAGMLLPMLAVAGGAASYALRRFFPGPLERAVSTSGGDEWVVRPIGQDSDEGQGFACEGFHYPQWPDGEPAVDSLEILASSWRRMSGGDWSAWAPAYGGVYPKRRSNDLYVTWSPSKTGGLSGDEHLELRLKVLVTLEARDEVELPPGDAIKARGHGWVYGRYLYSPQSMARERGRVAPGVGIEGIRVTGGPLYSSWFPHGRWRKLKYVLPGKDYSERPWDSAWLDPRSGDFQKVEQAPVRITQVREEQCVRTVRVTSLRKTFPRPEPELPKEKPRAPSPPPPPDPEPFRGHLSTFVWQPGSTLPVPDASAPEREATYYIHWLKGRKELSEPEKMPAFIAKWWSQCLEIAVLNPLHRDNALVQALVAGFPDEHRSELLRRFPGATWLAPVIEQRGWQEEVKSVVLERIRSGKSRMDDSTVNDLMPLCRALRDPVFHDWMRRHFTLDVPTVLYWESMPDLAAELPERLDEARREFPWKVKQWEALVTGGQPKFLNDLLHNLTANRSDNWRQIHAAYYLERSVLDADGRPPPPSGLVVGKEGKLRYYQPRPVSQEFMKWFEGLSADDFTFDRAKRRFVRKLSTPKAP
jgi:hypothetical protein